MEVILALAILAISMSLLSQLVSIGTYGARQARDLTEAQILCESIISEVAAGVMPMQNVPATPWDDGTALPTNTPWLYSIEVEPTSFAGLLSVRVVVEELNANSSPRAARYEIVRWMPDPEVVYDLMSQQLQQEQDAADAAAEDAAAEDAAAEEEETGGAP